MSLLRESAVFFLPLFPEYRVDDVVRPFFAGPETFFKISLFAQADAAHHFN